MASTMRTGQLFGHDAMRCVEVPAVERQPGHVIVQTDMASICGSDLHVVKHSTMVVHPFPCPHGYPGHEGIGKIVDPGDSLFSEGDQVLCFPNVFGSMGFSEFQSIDPKYLLALPETGVTAAEMLMAQQLGTVLFAARQRPIDVVGRTALVLGQGSAGLFWAWLLKRQGADRVIVTDRASARLAASADFGADVIIDRNTDDLESAVMDLTGEGADYVIEAVGHREVLAESIALTRPDGDLMWFGLPDSNDGVPINFHNFFRKRLTATSTYGAQDEADAASFKFALELIANGQIDVSPLLSHVYPVEEIDTAFEVAYLPQSEGALKVSISF